METGAPGEDPKKYPKYLNTGKRLTLARQLPAYLPSSASANATTDAEPKASRIRHFRGWDQHLHGLVLQVRPEIADPLEERC